jgi:hypothetical protein
MPDEPTPAAGPPPDEQTERSRRIRDRAFPVRDAAGMRQS